MAHRGKAAMDETTILANVIRKIAHLGVHWTGGDRITFTGGDVVLTHEEAAALDHVLRTTTHAEA